MSAKLVLYFTATGHTLYRYAGGALELEATFGADAQGLQAFRAGLQGRKGALVYVVADLAGEDFHEDQIPYLRGNDRQSVVQRRLAQRYRDTRLAAALSLGFATGERRTERLLLASFTNPEQFTPWIEALVESGARLSGVYSVPLLAPALAARLGVRTGRSLIVTVNSAGLRQCFVEDGRLRFARLERILETAPDALAAFVRAETLRLIQYLSTLRTVPRDGPPIQVLVIVPAGQRSALEQVLVSDARLTFQTIAADEAARKVGVKRPAASLPGEQLFLTLAIRKPPKEQFARGEDRRSFILWRLQRAILGAGAAGFLGCAVVAAAQGLDLLGLKQRAAEQQRESADATGQYQRITASFPVTQTTTDNLKATVVEFTRIATQSASPEPALVYLSQVVEKYPQMDIESVAWRVSKPSADTGAAKGGAAPAPGAEVLQILEVSGRVNATRRSDYRAITGQVQSFAEALRTDPAWRILRTQLPFDVTSAGTLSGDIGAGEGTEAPRFTIAVGRPLKMNFTTAELKKLALPLLLLVALLGAGAGLILWVQAQQKAAERELAAASAERAQARERLTRIAEEEKEVNDKLAVYRRLKSLHILGEEQRLEWADAMTRIRTTRELLDLRYLVDRQRLIGAFPGKPAGVDFYASTMKVDIALLHEGDLLTFLRELRDSGNAYYSIRRCTINRTGTAPTGTSIVPRLRAECEIDLITIIDRAAKA